MNRTSTLFAVWLFALPVAAAPAANPYCYDGARKLTLTPEPGLVAEFAKAGAKSAVKKANPAAVEVKAGVGGPRLYKVPSEIFKPRTDTGTSTSPVFRMGTSPAGRLMALPGGVIVTFKPDWSDAQARAWAADKGFAVQQRLNLTGNWYVLKTEPGLAALAAANAIHEGGEVISATPNWWKETVTR